MRLPHLVPLLALASLAPAARAQQTSAAPRTSAVSIQPLSAVAGIYALEYEHATSRHLSIGVGGTFSRQSGSDWFGEGDSKVTYASGDLKLRYYPEGRALAGFSVGALAGYVSARETSKSYFAGATQTTRSNGSAPAFGISLDYTWLLGGSRSFYLALGAGAKRLLLKQSDVPDALTTYPTARISVGYAF
ncbi:MAG TPA: DUF3575 domain-containing protein [Gemmatimonadaceae bacterium]